MRIEVFGVTRSLVDYLRVHIVTGELASRLEISRPRARGITNFGEPSSGHECSEEGALCHRGLCRGFSRYLQGEGGWSVFRLI